LPRGDWTSPPSAQEVVPGMPIYEYQCTKCGHRFEVSRKFSDPPIKTCQRNGCRAKVQKVLSPPMIMFKGSGFYSTDYGSGDGNGRRKSAQSEKPCTEAAKDACKAEGKSCPALDSDD